MSSPAEDPRLRPDPKWWPWVVRVVWVAVPFMVGPALADALDGRSPPVASVASGLAWAGWALGVVAGFVPHALSLTALRLLAPAAVASAALAGGGGAAAWPVAVGWAALGVGVVFSSGFGEWCVNGPAYPNERRLLLRLPAALLAGPVALAWALAGMGLAAGPLLTAAGNWPGALAATVLGWPVAAVVLRALHQLSRRWVVFVPAGLVVHDLMVLDAPILVPRARIVGLRPAPADSTAHDLTQRAPGLLLELRMDSPLDLGLVRPGRKEPASVSADSLLLAPSRPGRVLAEAGRRRIKLG